MIRIDLGAEGPAGQWAYSIRNTPVQGRSHQPLLDACRKLHAMGGRSTERAGLFRSGKDTPDIHCRVDYGAAHTVVERNKGQMSLEPVREFWLAKAA